MLMIFIVSAVVMFVLVQMQTENSHHLVGVAEENGILYEIMKPEDGYECLYLSPSLNKFDMKYMRSLNTGTFDAQYVNKYEKTKYSLTNNGKGKCTFNPYF